MPRAAFPGTEERSSWWSGRSGTSGPGWRRCDRASRPPRDLRRRRVSPLPGEGEEPVAEYGEGLRSRPRAILRLLRPALRWRVALGHRGSHRLPGLPGRAAAERPVEALGGPGAVRGAESLPVPAGPPRAGGDGCARDPGAEARQAPAHVPRPRDDRRPLPVDGGTGGDGGLPRGPGPRDARAVLLHGD